jgi:hypothetical protein
MSDFSYADSGDSGTVRSSARASSPNEDPLRIAADAVEDDRRGFGGGHRRVVAEVDGELVHGGRTSSSVMASTEIPRWPKNAWTATTSSDDMCKASGFPSTVAVSMTIMEYRNVCES